MEVDAGEDQSAEAGASITLVVAVSAAYGSEVIGYEWEQTAGVPAQISGADSDTLAVTLGDAEDYRAELMTWLVREDRLGVQAINPHSLEEAEIKDKNAPPAPEPNAGLSVEPFHTQTYAASI